MSTFWTMFSGVPILREFLGYTAGLVCPQSEDGYHHASSYEVDGENGYYDCVCSKCGWPFIAYETDLQQSYDTFVESLENPVVSSSGASLRCYPTSLVNRILVSSLSDIVQESGFEAERQWYFDDLYTFVQKSSRGSYKFSPVWFYFQVPVSGYYYISFPINTFNLSPNLCAVYSWGSDDQYCKIISYNTDDSSVVTSLTSIYFDSNVVYAVPAYLYPDPVKGQVCTHTATMSLAPDYSHFTGIVVDASDSSYRPTSFVGDYGIIGDNGQITKVDNTSIVNETNNTYTNPCTGTTSTITEWTYDYSDRSYNVTTESGDTVTITYGDENITIQEGDTIYNVYYMVDEDPGGEPGVDPTESPAPEVCQHKYTSVTDREATCTFAGQVTYTCSLCGYSYTESIPATGHVWDIKETVQTSYDEEGNLLQQGYTIYKCSVCGEEYKDETGTGPPGSGDGSGSGSGEEGESIWDKLGNLIGTILGTIIDIISAVIGKILDALLALVEMIGDKLVAVVDLVLSFFDEIPRLFSGFLAFLTAVFPFLPEEVMLLLTFGIAVIVFIGIIKALRR